MIKRNIVILDIDYITEDEKHREIDLVADALKVV